VRAALLGTPLPPWGSLIYSSVVAIAIFMGGAFIFKMTERKFADVI
jgi:ABC-type polysaccharide/polyol phosphate export permease